MALKRTGFGVSEVALSRLCGYITVGVQSDVPLNLHMHAMRNTIPSVNEPLLQLVNAVFRFLCNVRWSLS